ncbi:hypothetical protein [Microvirga pudoricolor]|uniref:hypothetical protein n=1 Tax=Microvirga pudoricolor TaxID=2778729 RepID=UPI00194E7FAD|nr:hypothetical protein [Microvirga pudoricolor]MBM6595411.1 hypothetical protein [Microvirga pudoricolor]
MEEYPIYVWLEGWSNIKPIRQRADGQDPDAATRRAAGWWRGGAELTCRLVDTAVKFWVVWAVEEWDYFEDFLENEEAGKRLGIEPRLPAMSM